MKDFKIIFIKIDNFNLTTKNENLEKIVENFNATINSMSSTISHQSDIIWRNEKTIVSQQKEIARFHQTLDDQIENWRTCSNQLSNQEIFFNQTALISSITFHTKDTSQITCSARSPCFISLNITGPSVSWKFNNF